MMDSDQILCDRARQGELPAASELVARFYQRIFAYFRRLCGNEPDAADLTQKTFAKAWVSLGSYQGRSTFSTWLHGIAYHAYVDWHRARRLADAQTDEWWEAQAAEAPSPYENAAEQELGLLLCRWVDGLDEEKKQAVHLHYYQGLSLNETAETLGVATSTVKYRLREAIAFLRTRAADPALPQTRKTL